MCEQIKCIGLAALWDKYSSTCAKNEWSRAKATIFLDKIEDLYNCCIMSIQIAALVDIIGGLLVAETCIYESKESGKFTV